MLFNIESRCRVGTIKYQTIIDVLGCANDERQFMMSRVMYIVVGSISVLVPDLPGKLKYSIYLPASRIEPGLRHGICPDR